MTLRPRHSGSFAMRHLRPQIQALQRIESINALTVNRKTLASEKHVDARVAVANTNARDLLDACGERDVKFAYLRFVVER